MRFGKAIRILVLVAALLIGSVCAADSCRIRLEKYVEATETEPAHLKMQYGSGEQFQDEVIVTAAHVVGDFDKGFTILVEDSNGWTRAKILYMNKKIDIAFVVPVKPVELKHTELSDGAVASPAGSPLKILEFKDLKDEQNAVRLMKGLRGMSGSVLYIAGKRHGVITRMVSLDGDTPLFNHDGSVTAIFVPWELVLFVWSQRLEKK